MKFFLFQFGFHYTGRNGASDDETTMFWWWAPFVIAFVGFFYLRIRYRRKYKYWTKGIFPANLPFTRMNQMMAYLCTAILLLHCDKVLFFKKMAAMHLWLRQRFPEIKIDTKSYIEEAVDNPVTPESLGNWLHLHLNTAQKEELLTFLLHLAFYDDKIQAREYDLLVFLAQSLEVGKDWLDERVSREQQSRYERESRQAAEPRETSVSKKVKALETLGLDALATIQQIKQAYRKLVKLCHPDKFQQESEYVRKEAEAKFREIQEAYEYLQLTVT